MAHAIELRGLTRWYGKRRGVLDLDVAVEEGEVFGFLGPNGSGKTTTIRMLLGLIRPSAGAASVWGLDAWRDAPTVHRRLAHLGSDPGYLGEMSAARLLDHLGALRGLPAGAWRTLAERLDLDPSVAVKKLSRGNRQKVGVVQAFMGSEPLLVMDEPSTGLDPLMQREFLALVAEARSAGRTVFLSSHNLTEVERACDRVAIIREGRLVKIATVQALVGDHTRSINLLLDRPAPDGTFVLDGVTVLSSTGQDVHLMVRGDVNPLLRRLAELEVRDIAISTPDVEDLFFRYYEGSVAGSEGRTAAATGPETPVEVSR
ncbi:MAG TPA: ABC transporter ATP-binding protein [Candidatus Nanopelagicales bacterium]|nr:ABC transporter ATP-binding protein [Candidatus Nanopelagicales bacterium]